MKCTLLATLLLLAPSISFSAPADGQYDLADCIDPYSDGRVALSGNQLAFHESSCVLTDATPMRGIDAGVLYDATCSGEGETWTERYLLASTYDGGLMILRKDGATTYQRCSP